ncbi:Exodeoxyribonuclease I subunit D [Nitrosomonas aestuarii]|uniref:Nuclease SbcCD subunit D n=1 Tax=Nitrosomonas aestuarii TaxID=52441 RepID=A0A1I4FSF6_9PROT|nr:exonuclease SbcCD subunit D C-terminal domain-containing protein [Nitrosomonas aestuarii]SFL20210.1 Exodeoxyribonuclease I subunit D [Nitrosomonas aestuarii]
MKILHTSDWHIGRTLYGRKRYAEFEAFLSWLIETIQCEEIDALLVAGDVFDTTTPSNASQTLYYRFLCRVAASCCRHVVVIAGNHDSPSFLNAPRELLKTLDVHVVGSVSEYLSDEVLVLNNENGVPELIVCAVPYLRDRDIRLVEAGESVEDKERKLIEGIRSHYSEVVAIAIQKRDELLKQLRQRAQLTKQTIPIVALGHLFTAGGQTVEGDGVRELYVGSLAHVSSGIFPDSLDYLALGHLHVPQKVGGSEIRRYSGSPLSMGFGEARQQKSVVIVEFDAHKEQGSQSIENPPAKITLIPVPAFQMLERVEGDWKAISNRILELSATESQVWLEVIFKGNEIQKNLRERLDAIITGSKLEVLRVKNTRIIDQVLNQIHDEETLDDIDVNEVFERCLAANNVSNTQRPELIQAYKEVMMSLYEDERAHR